MPGNGYAPDRLGLGTGQKKAKKSPGNARAFSETQSNYLA
jgi:hypothetical protein